MAQVIDVEDNNCSLRGFERNRYFFGKPMMVRDFDAEQQYFNGKRYLLNRLVHGAGIVCGLGMTANESGGFTLKAGAAIDCCGREIVVGSDYNQTDLTELEGYRSELVNQNQTIYLCLVYDECIREPVHTQATASSCADACDYNRIREGFKVVIKTTAPAAATDFCEVTSSKKIVFEDNRLRLERIAPLWVNPKDVFEVQLVATPLNVSGTLEVEVEESFTPVGQLTVVQGISPLTRRVSFSLTQGGDASKKSYLLRASEAIIQTEIKAVILFPPTEVPMGEEPGSTVEITAQKVSELMAGKIFRDEKLGACTSCKDDHCLYLASAQLGEDGKLTGLQSFPSNQYVYNNSLLFELLACGENRIGKIPEIPVSNATTQVVPAVTAFKFFKGLTVADGGLGKADVTAKVDKGLKIASDAIVADLGTGLVFDGNHIKADLGKGVVLDGNHIDADLGNGLVFDGNHIAARTGQGVKLSGNLIAANLGDGLRLDATDRITAHTGSGLNLSGQQIVAEVGNGVKIVGNQIQPDYSAANDAGKVCQANDPRLSNARTPLPHAATHRDGGTDELNVGGLSGVLQDAQRVEVQDEGANVATRPRLNFVGPGVTVTDEAAENRVNINIPQSGRVSTGLVRFLDVQEGEPRFSPLIVHHQESNTCAIVLALVLDIRDTGEMDLFGDPGTSEDVPVIVAFTHTAEKSFFIHLRDRRVRKQQTVNYTIRWWAIPNDLDTPIVNVPKTGAGGTIGHIPVTEDVVRVTALVNPGASREELAASLGIEASAMDTHINNLKSAGKISVVEGKIFPK